MVLTEEMLRVRAQAQAFVLDNICFSPLPAAQWPPQTVSPPAVPSSCPDLLLSFDDVSLGELCVLTTLAAVSASQTPLNP